MWTYIIRRLLVMIPTLFGVTIVSFCIMQMAPGDPLLSKLGPGGAAGISSQTREAYLIQKRDLHLDKPLVLNLNYFRDFTEPVRIASHLRSLSTQEVADELARLASSGQRDDFQVHMLTFLRSLDIPNFDKLLYPPQLTADALEASGMTADEWEERKRQMHVELARSTQGYLQVWCENIGSHGVPPAIGILESDSASRELKIGAINVLSLMVVTPFRYTFSRDPSPEEERQVVATWEILWSSERSRFPPVDPDRRRFLEQEVSVLQESGSRSDMFNALTSGKFDRDDTVFFAEVLLGEAPLEQKVIAAEFLRLYISRRVQVSVAADASSEEVQQVARNWIGYYQSHLSQYRVGLLRKLWLFIADTQYAHMVWRLATFDFGRSALKTAEPVSQIIWRALLVSAPLMIMAQLVIYLVAIPLGVICSVNRAKLVDRLISLLLFFLYSVPPFVAGMLFLLFFCYGDYMKWFPMERLHSPGAERFGMGRYLLDYAWHCFLPVVCLSLFSLAGLAMYSRSSMLDVLGQDYIRTARAKGVSNFKVVFKHALRNGLIPIITLFANFLPAMLGGSVLIEYIFNIPGMGRLSFTSIEQKDFPTLMALIYIDAIVVMLSILMTDMLYVFVDPRISFEGQGGAS